MAKSGKDYPRTTHVTCRRLGEFLVTSGFKVRKLDDGALMYRHPGSEALLIFPTFPGVEHVFPHHLVATRVALEWFGHMEPLEFDRWVYTHDIT